MELPRVCREVERNAAPGTAPMTPRRASEPRSRGRRLQGPAGRHDPRKRARTQSKPTSVTTLVRKHTKRQRERTKCPSTWSAWRLCADDGDACREHADEGPRGQEVHQVLRVAKQPSPPQPASGAPEEKAQVLHQDRGKRPRPRTLPHDPRKCAHTQDETRSQRRHAGRKHAGHGRESIKYLSTWSAWLPCADVGDACREHAD